MRDEERAALQADVLKRQQAHKHCTAWKGLTHGFRRHLLALGSDFNSSLSPLEIKLGAGKVFFRLAGL